MIALAAALGCSSDPAPPAPRPSDGGADGGPIDASGGGTLTGTIKDKAGEVVGAAMVEVGGVSGFSDTQGKYTVTGVPPGAATVKVTRNWFKPSEHAVTVAADRATALDLTIDEVPIEVRPADQMLADTYNKTFDWTKQPLSVSVAPAPTRRHLDNAIYFRNPALYRDTSKEAPLSPTPAPEIAAGMAKNFSFPLQSGPHMGKEAFDPATIVDAFKDTPFGTAKPAFLTFAAVAKWLSEWNTAKSADLLAVGVAVRQQSWGGNAIRPQEIERLYVGEAGALWAEVAFAPFVQLGPGITDDDGDGRKEIFARIAAPYAPAEVVETLTTDYIGRSFTTHGLSKELTRSLNELYSSTAAQVERTIGQPYEAAGVGTIMYPFVVVKHAAGQRNVILVSPAP